MYFKKDLVLLNGKGYPDRSNGSHTIGATPFNHEVVSPIIENPRLAKISSTILLLTIAGFIISEFLHFLHIANIGLSVIALLGGSGSVSC